jgi:hypothetical protein
LAVGAAIAGPCRAVAISNITLSGEQTVGGVALVTNDRVLVIGQTDASSNGAYIVDTGPWVRARDFDSTQDVRTGTLVYVTSGTNAGLYVVTTTGTIAVGTDNIALSRLVAAP